MGQGMVAPAPPSPAPLAIRRARLMLGLTQAQAGALIYRTGRSWISWESGARQMDPLMWEVFLERSKRVAAGKFPRTG